MKNNVAESQINELDINGENEGKLQVREIDKMILILYS